MKNLKIEEMLRNAKDCFSRNEFKKAGLLFNEVIESGTDEKSHLVEAYFHMANVFHLKGDIGKAIKAFNKVLSLDPNHTDASISLSVLYNDIGHYEEAKKIFDQANERVKSGAAETLMEDLHINKKFANKHYELAEMYLTYNRYDEALFEYNKTTALDPSNLDARMKVAKVYAKKNFMTKSFDELKKLKNEHPNFLPGRVSLGILYYGQGKILEAQAEWEKVLSKEPQNSEAAMYLNLSKTATETRI